jgi:hypothetical protein
VAASAQVVVVGEVVALELADDLAEDRVGNRRLDAVAQQPPARSQGRIRQAGRVSDPPEDSD